MVLRRWILGSVAAAVLVAGVALGQSKDEQKRAELQKGADETLQALFKQVEGSKALYDKAKGYAVFGTTKAGFIVTGGGGSGVAVDKSTNTTSYMKMGMGGVGFGIGAQKYDMVMLFETKERLDNFIKGGWDSAAGAKAVAGKQGAGVATNFVNGEIIYTIGEKGLMASADVSGAKFWLDEDLNKK
jgi:lipid-binding SYLF domain-containing protein